jgi:peptidoglycan/LPS O-acetylase OafA/YrhL
MSTRGAAVESSRGHPRAAAGAAAAQVPPSRTHVPALDGLRGLAIALVLVYHFTLGMRGDGLSARLFFKLTSLGWCGVDLFFVLSGFLITGILCDAGESPHRFRNFYARRALRIFPLYYAALAIVFAAMPLLGSAKGVRAELEDARIWLWCYGANILVALRDSWFPLSHFWSLAVEEHFYIFWPAIILGCDRRTAMRLCAAMIVAALTVRLWMVSAGAVLAAYCLTICRVDALAIGGCLALAVRQPGGLAVVLAHRTKVALGAAFSLLALAVWRRGLLLYDPVVQLAGYALLDLLFAALLLTALASESGGRFNGPLARGPLRWLGRYSYGLYVYNSIFVILAERSSLMGRLVEWSGSSLAGRLCYVVLLALLTVGTAWLSWHLLEKRFLNLKRYFPMHAGERYSVIAAPHLS